MDACAFEGIAIGRSQAVAGFGELGIYGRRKPGGLVESGAESRGDGGKGVANACGNGAHACDGAKRDHRKAKRVFGQVLSLVWLQEPSGILIQSEDETIHSPFPLVVPLYLLASTRAHKESTR